MIPEHIETALRLALRRRLVTHVHHFSTMTLLIFHGSIPDNNKHALCQHFETHHGYKTSLSPRKDKMCIFYTLQPQVQWHWP